MNVDPLDVQREWIDRVGVWCLLRLHGKRPIDAGWATEPRKWPTLWQHKLAGHRGNLGVPTGLLPSGLYLVGGDFDEYVSGCREMMVDLFAAGVPRETVTTITPGKEGVQGSHLLWLSEWDVPSRTIGPGVEVKCEGRQLVVPPSSNGRGEYAHEDGYGLDLPRDRLALSGFPLPSLSLEAAGALGYARPHIHVVTEHDDTRNGNTATAAMTLYGFHSPRWKNDGTVELVREGRESREHIAATVGHIGPGVLHCFTDNVPKLDQDGNYTCFQLYGRRGLPDPRFAALRDAIPQRTEAEHARMRRDGGVLMTANMVTGEHVSWLHEPLLPIRVVTLMVGVDGVGKSSVLYEMSAAASRGDLPGAYSGVPIDVVIASAEDHPGSVIIPKLVAANAALDRIHIFRMRREGIDGDMALPEDLLELERSMRTLDHPRLLVVDPLVAHLPVDIDTHKAQHVRAALAPLSRLAEDLGMAVVCVIHFNGGASSDVRQRISGSKAMRDASRSVILCGRDPRDETSDHFVLVQNKNSFGPRARRGRLYRIEPIVVAYQGDSFATTRIVYGAEIDVTAEDVVRGPERPKQGAPREVAGEWLEGRLRLAPGHRARARDLFEAAKAVGISASALRNAKSDLNVEHFRIGIAGREGGHETWWRLAEDGDKLVSYDSRGGESDPQVTGDVANPVTSRGDSLPRDTQLTNSDDDPERWEDR